MLHDILEALGLTHLDDAELKAIIILGIVSIWADRVVLVAAKVVRTMTPVVCRLLVRIGLHAEHRAVEVAKRPPRPHIKPVHHSARALALDAARIAATGAAVGLLIEPAAEDEPLP